MNAPMQRTTDKILMIEEDLIATMLFHPEIILTVPFEVSIFRKWGNVVHCLIKQINKGITPDLVTVSDELPGTLHDLGIIMKNCVGSTASYEYKLNLLTELTSDVEVYKRTGAFFKAIRDDGDSVKDRFTVLLNEGMALLSRKAKQYTYTAADSMKLLLDDIEESFTKRDENRVRTGIRKLDGFLGSFNSGDLVIIGARPAMGKTAMAVTVMLNSAQEGKRVGVISTEMSIQQMSYRMASQESGINAKKFRDGSFQEQDWSLVTKATAKLAKLNIRICDNTSMTISQIMMQCRAWDMDGGLDVVLIDYLTRIKPDKATQNRNQDVGEIAASLKDLARNLKIPVICLAQLNRGSANRADKQPVGSDLRDSGVIEQEADMILLLHREKQENGEMMNKIIVDKNRHGEAGVDVLVNFDESTMKWS